MLFQDVFAQPARSTYTAQVMQIKLPLPGSQRARARRGWSVLSVSDQDAITDAIADYLTTSGGIVASTISSIAVAEDGLSTIAFVESVKADAVTAVVEKLNNVAKTKLSITLPSGKTIIATEAVGTVAKQITATKLGPFVCGDTNADAMVRAVCAGLTGAPSVLTGSGSPGAAASLKSVYYGLPSTASLGWSKPQASRTRLGRATSPSFTPYTGTGTTEVIDDVGAAVMDGLALPDAIGCILVQAMRDQASGHNLHHRSSFSKMVPTTTI